MLSIHCTISNHTWIAAAALFTGCDARARIEYDLAADRVNAGTLRGVLRVTARAAFVAERDTKEAIVVAMNTDTRGRRRSGE